MAFPEKGPSYRFHETVQCACTEDDLKAAATTFAAEIGYHHFAYFSSGASFRLMTNYPNDWICRYRQKHYNKIDPVVIHSTKCTAIANWGQIYANASLPQRDFFLEAKAFGIDTGIIVPIGGTGTTHGALALASPLGDDVPVSDAVLRFFAVQLHVGLRHAKRQCFTEGTLNASEAYLLLWQACGMRTSDIAVALSVSERSLRHRMTQIKRKLQASSLHHALAIAQGAGLIDLKQLGAA